MVPCHHTCHCVSLCTLLLMDLYLYWTAGSYRPYARYRFMFLAHSVPFQMKNTLCSARWKLKSFGYRSFSVQAPLVWSEQPSCSHPTLQFSLIVQKFFKKKLFFSPSLYYCLLWATLTLSQSLKAVLYFIFYFVVVVAQWRFHWLTDDFAEGVGWRETGTEGTIIECLVYTAYV